MRLIDADALIRTHKSETSTIGKDWTVGDLAAAIELAPTIDAIPVEWLKAQIRSYTGDVSDIGKSARNGTIKDLIRKWQKEQEVQD